VDHQERAADLGRQPFERTAAVQLDELLLVIDLPDVRDAGEFERAPYVVMELIEGETLAKRYRNPTDITVAAIGNIDFARGESSGFNAPHAWRGAYLRGPVETDPWGNRYAVNVAFLDPRLDAAPVAVNGVITAGFGTATYPRLDVFAISAGPDEEIDTKSAQDGAVAGDDDFIYVVSSNAK